MISTQSNGVTEKIYRNCISDIECEQLKKVEYTAAKTLMLIAKKSLSKYYWINVGDKSIPFGGVIEHTNMISKDNYDNKHIIYISNYMYKNDELYKYNAKQLLDKYMPYLKKINKDFNQEDIEDMILSEAEYAQPLIRTNYSKEKANFKIKDEDLYIANMEQIYPEDRGMNYAIRLGYNIADTILDNCN